MGKDTGSTNAMLKLSIHGTSTPIESARTKRNKASQACAKCRVNQKRCENGVSPAEAEKQNAVPRSCDRCIRTGSACLWGDIDFRNNFRSRDALTMEAQIEQLRSENATLRHRLEEHGLNSEVDVEADLLDSSDNEECSQEGSTGRKGKQVGKDWYGGPSPFKDQDEADAGTTHSPMPQFPSPVDLDNLGLTSYQLCTSLHEVQSLNPRTAHEWLRYLPGDTASFLSRIEHDRALQNFFAFFSDWQLRVIPHLFLRDFALATGYAHNRRLPAPRSHTQHYSPLTHNAILSVALAYSDNEHLRSRETREKFAKHAKLFLEAECRSATLSTVQGLAILSSFHSGFAEQSLGFMYFGTSVRMAQALGLHVSAGASDPASVESSERDYVFWSLFGQDKCWSLYVGRDQGIRVPHYDVLDPSINEQMDNTPWMWACDDEHVPSQQPSYLSQSFVHQVSLMKIAGSIIDVVYSMKSSVCKGGLDISKVADLHLQLRLWEAKLSRTLHIADTSVKTSCAPPHIMMVNLAYHWLLILSLRPLFKPGNAASVLSSSAPPGASGDGNSVNTNGQGRAKILQALREAAASQCPASANQIVRLFNRYDTLYGLRFIAITAPQIVYTAGQVHLGMYFAATTPSAREKSHIMVVNCIGILEKIGATWASGSVTASILKRLLATGGHRSGKPSPRMVETPSSTDPSASSVTLWPDFHHLVPPMLGGDADITDYIFYLGHDHSGQLPLSLTAPADYGLNVQEAASSNSVSGTLGNAAHHHISNLLPKTLSVPSAHPPTSSTFDTSIPAWLIPLGDAPEPSEHTCTWDSSPANHLEQQQAPAQLLGSATVRPGPNVDPLQGWIPSTSFPTPSLHTGNTDPAVALYVNHGEGIERHLCSSEFGDIMHDTIDDTVYRTGYLHPATLDVITHM